MNPVALTGVERVFAGNVPIRALAGVDLTVGAGEYVALAGPSGSGKTTLLNIIGLLDRPSAGQVVLEGTDMTGAAERERSRLRAARIGFVFQAFHLVAHLTAEENVRLGMTYGIVPRRERSRRARMMLEQVGLGGREESLPGQLSAGQQQRTAVARALVSGCRLLLCDEPTGNLDGTSTAVVLDLLDRLREGQEMTVVTATHDPLVSARADRVVRVADGRVDAT